MSIVEPKSDNVEADKKEDKPDGELVKRLLAARERKNAYNKAYNKKYREEKRAEVLELKEELEKLRSLNVIKGRSLTIIKNNKREVHYDLDDEVAYIQLVSDMMETLKALGQIVAFEFDEI